MLQRMDTSYHPELAPKRRGSWLIATPLILVLVAAAAWTAVWFYAAGRAETLVNDWRTQQARAGRVFSCAEQRIGGFPFRIEVHCNGAGVELKDTQPALAIKLKEIIVVAQVWDPKLMIAEFTGPLTAAEVGQQKPFTFEWTLAQASVRGTPSVPERASIAIDGLKVSEPGRPLMEAQHAEFHARVQFGSWPHNPAIDLAVSLKAATAASLSPFLSVPTDADITAVLHGLKDLKPKPMPARLREWQAASGRVEIQKSRLAQGDSLATATGTLALTKSGRLDGTLQVTAAGLERFVPALGGNRDPAIAASPALGAIERAVPQLGGALRPQPQQPPNALQTGLLALLGKPAELEGKRAVVMPLAFVDGAVKLGPIPVGTVPPLF